MSHMVVLEELSKALDSLKTSKALLKNAIQKEPSHIELHKALRSSCIRRFGFCIELSWKTSIKALGLETKAPNPAIRDMAQNQLIDNPNIWFEFLLARNKTSHTYDEDVAREVYLVVEKAIPEFADLLARLKKL